MKQPNLIRFLTKTLLFTACCLPLSADSPAPSPLEVKWDTLCRVAKDDRLVVTTTQGDVVEGHCLAIQVDVVTVVTKDNKTIRIARSALQKVQLQPVHERRLRALGKGLHEGFQRGFDLLLSPMAPVGLVALPGTVAWGAIAAPFCGMGT